MSDTKCHLSVDSPSRGGDEIGGLAAPATANQASQQPYILPESKASHKSFAVAIMIWCYKMFFFFPPF